VTLGAGLALALASTVALNLGWVVQHDAVAGLPRLGLRHPVRALGVLLRSPRWLAGFVTGLGGWGLYIAALALAPLSLVQGISAGGIGLLALAAQRLRGVRLAPREAAAVALSVGGLVLLAASLAGGVAGGRTSTTGAVLVWLAASVVGVALLAGPVARTMAGGAGLGLAAGTLYAAGDVATKAAVGGHAVLILAVLASHGAAFAALQLAFQRGGALATAGLNTLATNALPIVAGLALFHEHVPGGAAGAARFAAFALVVLGAVLLAREDDVQLGLARAQAS
jgi:hypothetical protein